MKIQIVKKGNVNVKSPAAHCPYFVEIPPEANKK